MQAEEMEPDYVTGERPEVPVYDGPMPLEDRLTHFLAWLQGRDAWLSTCDGADITPQKRVALVQEYVNG